MTGKSTAQMLREKSTKTIKIIDETDEDKPEYDFKIQRLSTIEMIEAQNTENVDPEFQAALESKDPTKVDPQKVISKLKDNIFPMMKKFIPICTLSPKVVFDDKDLDPNDADIIHQRIIPKEVLFALFNEILKFSGLDSESFDDVKKKQKVQSSKTS